MEKHNHTAMHKVTEFVLTGITDSPELQAPLFGIFLVIYLVTVTGNLGMVILTHLDSKLHTPMYFFLRHLSITDLGYSTVIGPKMTVNFVVHKNMISYNCVPPNWRSLRFLLSLNSSFYQQWPMTSM